MAVMKVRTEVDGIVPLIDKLTVFRKTVRQLKPAFEKIAQRTFIMARFLAPVYGGKTKASIRAKGSNMQAYAKAGGASHKSHGGGIYVKMNHFGTRWDPQAPYPFMFITLAAQARFARDDIEREVIKKKEAAGL
ncbi:hypothetical protein [Rhodococcoides fascians]|uniref:hypothetical protein n=1 Tax=Rhodococcoides fascians TaxID=1828 RepID=UPI0005601D8A|nr:MULTISPECIES: hypothetical protein [Rhodococcus]OZF05567.1 hypothetical protein CH301_04040 [Rhodococcus sp. 15-1189-1-1a]OZF20351.1 hypothetical protein CH299_04585 [Rhodococcus sp. 14-2686-1-2]